MPAICIALGMVPDRPIDAKRKAFNIVFLQIIAFYVLYIFGNEILDYVATRCSGLVELMSNDASLGPRYAII